MFKRREFLRAILSVAIATKVSAGFYNSLNDDQPAALGDFQFEVPAGLKINAGETLDLKRFVTGFNGSKFNKIKFGVDSNGAALPHGVALLDNGLLIASENSWAISINDVVFTAEI